MINSVCDDVNLKLVPPHAAYTNQQVHEINMSRGSRLVPIVVLKDLLYSRKSGRWTIGSSRADSLEEFGFEPSHLPFKNLSKKLFANGRNIKFGVRHTKRGCGQGRLLFSAGLLHGVCAELCGGVRLDVVVTMEGGNSPGRIRPIENVFGLAR